LTTHTREATPITTRVSVQVMMEVFQLSLVPGFRE
jgi:hypothetical protein